MHLVVSFSWCVFLALLLFCFACTVFCLHVHECLSTPAYPDVESRGRQTPTREGELSKAQFLENREDISGGGRIIYLTFFFPPPKDKIEEIKKASAGKTLIELVRLGKPYKQGLYWFVSSTIKEHDDKVKSEQLRIRIYKFDGKRYCIIAMPD